MWGLNLHVRIWNNLQHLQNLYFLNINTHDKKVNNNNNKEITGLSAVINFDPMWLFGKSFHINIWICVLEDYYCSHLVIIDVYEKYKI